MPEPPKIRVKMLLLGPFLLGWRVPRSPLEQKMCCFSSTGILPVLCPFNIFCWTAVAKPDLLFHFCIVLWRT